jgi:hypothetical protein
MRRRLLVVLLGLTTALGLALPAHADPGVIKGVFIEDFQGTTPLDDPAFTDCLGYHGQIFEDRDGVYNLTIHTTGSMAGVTHVEGDVTASFVISPIQGTGIVYRGTYREHATGNFLIINDEDVPPPGRVLLPARDRHRERRLPAPLHQPRPLRPRQAHRPGPPQQQHHHLPPELN